MMDVRSYKTALRRKYKGIRDGMSAGMRAESDRKILKRLTSLYQYRRASLVLTYVSKDSEADTFALIKKSLAEGKQVAVPRCIDSRNMKFYYIEGTEMLEKSTFGVMEPIVSECRELTEIKNSICIVPGLSFDSSGYRLGYGKGYYDRFLADYKDTTVGICSSRCFCWKLPSGKFDRPVDILVTEKYLRVNNRV